MHIAKHWRIKQMFKNILLSLLLTSVMSIGSAFAADATYKLKAGDSLNVSVWGEETLQKDTKVLPDGSITFPLAGRVDVEGATAAEVEKRVTEKLKTYLPDPQVTVVVSGTEGNRIFILGKVLTPGPVLMTGPMTVMQALSLAGGLDKFADLGSIKVLRNGKNGQIVFPVDYNALIKGQKLESNILLNAGDTILIP
jgi:polysaccharide biosynthesis/export protein